MLVTNKQSVRVYYNLHKKCLSVMDKKTRRVVAHTNAIHLENVKFVVSAAGLKRVREQRRKQVIAFVEGDYCDSEYGSEVFDNSTWCGVYFNPYKVDQFMVGEHPIYDAGRAFIVDKNIYIKRESCVNY